MWIDQSDTTQLSQRLRVGPRELLAAIGGPWHVVSPGFEQEIEQPGTLFVGRAGPSVAIVVSDDVEPVVRVGVAVGEWIDPRTLVWSLRRPMGSVVVPGRGADDASLDRMLVDLRVAVDAAAAEKVPELVICRYCGGLGGPESAVSDDCCHGCGSTVFGIVY